jgi:hypothetical protein
MSLTLQLNAYYVTDKIQYSFTATGFPPGGSGRKTCTKIGKRQQFIKGETIHKTIQKHTIHKLENKHTKQEHGRKGI